MFNFFKKRKSGDYFVSIGAGFNQLPLIKAAKRLGFHIIGVDQNTIAAGIRESDIKIQESITNYEEIYKKLRELLIDGEIKGILTRSYGSAVKTTSFICDKFNIPHIPFSQMDNLLSKKKMKQVFKKNSIKSSPYQVYTPGKKVNIDYPFIIKPSEGHAKKGVMLVDSQKELNRYLKSNKGVKEFLVEKFIKGDEVIAIGIVHDSQFHLVEITDKVTTAPPYFVDLQHITPSKHLEKWDKIKEIGQSITEAFEIEKSPLLMELKIQPDGKIYVIETAAEFGGEFLAEKLIPARTGYNIIEEGVKSITGLNFTPPSLKKRKRSVIVQYLTAHRGIFKSFNPVAASKKSGLIFSRIFKDMGSQINKPVSNHDRVGVVVTSGKSLNIAIENSKKAVEAINIVVTKKEKKKRK